MTTRVEFLAADALRLPSAAGISLTAIRTGIDDAHGGSSHVDQMLRLYEWLVPTSALSHMTPWDWLLLTLSTYLHDLGLMVTEREFEARRTTGFEAFMRGLGSDDFHKAVNLLSAAEREKLRYDDFVRRHHGERLASWIRGEPDVGLGRDPLLASRVSELLEPFDPLVRNDLALLCGGHHGADLDDIDKFPVRRPYGVSDVETVNLQYLAALLLSADLLAVAGGRMPSVPQYILHPSSAGTELSWADNATVRAVRSRIGVDPDGTLNPELPRSVIEVHALAADEAQFFALNRYLQYTELEIARCHRALSRSTRTLASGHSYPWRQVDQQYVQAAGFVAQQFRFSLDPTRMLDLLTGHTLYNDANVVVRELVQNSIDAVRLQHGDTGGKVVVRWIPDELVLSVEDNGVGMTGEVLENHFLKVGSSRYWSPTFRRANPSFSPIGRFGIGFLAVFMVSDQVEVTSVSKDEDSARVLALQSVHGNYLMRILPKDSTQVPELCRAHGTSVRLRLRPSAELADVAETLRRWIVVPGCEVTMVTGDGDGDGVPIGHANARESLSAALSEALDNRVQHVEVRSATLGGSEIAYAVNRKRVLGQSHLASLISPPFLGQFDRNLVEQHLGTCVEGVRVTTASPGYQTTDIICLVNAVGHNAPRTNVARTALERTPELDVHLRDVYRTLAGEVRSELQRLVADEQLSPGAAAAEANCLVAPLLAGTEEAPALVSAAAAEIPAYVVESKTSRLLMSLAEMDSYAELATIESEVTSQAESLLAAAPNQSSVREVLQSWTQWSAALPDVPMLSRPEPATFYGELFVDAWDIAGIEVKMDGQLLDFRWRRAVQEEPRWLRAFGGRPPKDTHPAIRQLWSYDDGDGQRQTLLIPTADIAHNIDRNRWDGIRLPGLVVVLPNVAFLDAAPASDLMRHALAFVVRTLDRQQIDDPAADRRGNRLSKDGLRDVMVLMRRAGLLDYLDVATLVSSLSGLRLNLMEVTRQGS